MELKTGLYYTDGDAVFISNGGNYGTGIRHSAKAYRDFNGWGLNTSKLRMCNTKEINHLNKCIFAKEYIIYKKDRTIVIW